MSGRYDPPTRPHYKLRRPMPLCAGCRREAPLLVIDPNGKRWCASCRPDDTVIVVRD